MHKKEWTRRLIDLVNKKYNPSTYCWLFSGGDDSLTVGEVVSEFQNINYAIHCDTGTGIPETQFFVREHCIKKQIPLIIERPHLKDSYETYCLEYGFPGKNDTQHFEMYKRLKDHGIDRAISQIRKGKNIGKVVLISGARKEESKRRMGSAVNITEEGNLIWVNFINEWKKSECIDYLQNRNIERSPVVKILGRSGECNCGVYADREIELPLLKEHFPSFYKTLMVLEERVIANGFPWGWAEDIPHGLQKYKNGQQFINGFEPDWVHKMKMCTNCINKNQ